MKKSHPCIRAGLSGLVVLALSVACVPNVIAFSQEGAGALGGAAGASDAGAAPASTATFQKSETVYASLAPDGAPQAVYVVNRFDVERAGAIVDYGDYERVQSLTSDTELGRNGGATAFDAGEGAFFYQGDAERTALPWNVAITYRLDGKPVSAAELGGASGQLAIHVATSRNGAVEDASFYDSFMMQITFTLDGDACSNIVAEGATIANAGQDRTVAFTVLPGHDGSFELAATVEDFAMDGAQIAALPYSSVIEMPDTSEMTDGMTDLADAVSQLSAGTSSLAEGVDRLTSGARDLSSGSAAFGEGLSTLDGSSAAIVEASGTIDAALANMAAGLSGMDFSQLEQLAQLPGTLNQLADGLDALREHAAALQGGYDRALGALGEAIDAIPEGTLTQEQITKMISALTESDDIGTAGALAANYQAAQTVKGTYAATKDAFDGASQLLSALAADTESGGALATEAAALRTMADSIEASLDPSQLGRLSELAGALGTLSKEYGSFHEGLAQYASGLSALASNYNALASGTSSLAAGTGQLAGGAGTLAGGMAELNASTVTLPETMKEQVAEMTADYDFPEFKPVSFVDARNQNVAEVQFVMATPAVERPEAVEAEEPEQELSMWDRFLALFQG